MAVYRHKHTFNAGELSPLMQDVTGFDRHKNGCKVLHNMVCNTQGPVQRRPGFKFIYSLNDLGIDTTNPIVRIIPFIFSKTRSYSLIFYMHTSGQGRIVFGTTNSDGTDGLVVFSDPPITECPPGTPQTYSAGDIVTIVLPAAWDIENFDYAQSADTLYLVQSGLRPYTLKRYSHTCWYLSATAAFTSEPTSWTTNNWPQKVTFHQQRLVFAATALNPKTVWMTRAGDFSSFANNTGASGTMLDSDAVTFTLDSGQQNQIQWITSSKALLIGTLGDEWTVTGNNQTALTPSNILAQRQTNNGSEAVKPITVGLTTMFLERHGRVLNEFVYDYAFDSYKTTDMTILAPHLTELYSLTAWAYQQTPDSIIWGIREDGDLIGCTYQRQHKVVGWHRHSTDGAFKAITVIPGNTREDDVWVITKRVIDSVDSYYIEKMADYYKEDDPEWGRFLDSYLVYIGTATDTISLPHLVGKEVQILADGSVHPPQTVPSSGIVTLNDSYSHIVAGLAYESEVRPLLSDFDTREGSTIGRTQRITKVTIGFFKTVGGFIGTESDEDGEREEEIPFRMPNDLTGQPVPLFTGFYDYDFFEGFDNKSDYFIRQRQPLPMTILSVVDKVEVYE